MKKEVSLRGSKKQFSIEDGQEPLDTVEDDWSGGTVTTNPETGEEMPLRFLSAASACRALTADSESGDPFAGLSNEYLLATATKPKYTGLGHHPRIMSEEEWVSAAVQVVKRVGPEAFLQALMDNLRAPRPTTWSWDPDRLTLSQVYVDDLPSTEQ